MIVISIDQAALHLIVGAVFAFCVQRVRAKRAAKKTESQDPKK